MFIKYPSIENSYRRKEIDYWLTQYPELANEIFVIGEKLHGSNLQLIFKLDGTLRMAKRSGIILENENFYNADLIITSKYLEVIEKLKDYSIRHNKILNVYGEIFGAGIQKGVNYGVGKHYRIFDIAIDSKLCSPKDIEILFSALGIDLHNILVPVFAYVKGLEKALEYSIEDKVTRIYPEGNSIIEGIVIKPYEKIYVNNNGNVFMLKKKNEKFKEIERSSNKVPRQVDSKLEELRGEFEMYMTENRLQSIFSKYGEIDKPSQIGEYIKYMLADAREEFILDFMDEIQGLEKKELKYIYNVSKKIVEMLNKYL